MAEAQKTIDLPVWVYRGISVTLLTALLSVLLWTGGRILASVERTADAVQGIQQQVARFEARFEALEARISRAETRLDSSWRPSSGGRPDNP